MSKQSDELKQIDPEDLLNKAKITETIERRENTSSVKSVLAKVGEDEKPDGTEFMGSVAAQVYLRRKPGGNFDLEIQASHSLQTNSALLVNKILRHLCYSVARDYGWEFNKKQKSEIREL